MTGPQLRGSVNRRVAYVSSTLKRLSNRFESCQAQKVANLLTEALSPRPDSPVLRMLVRSGLRRDLIHRTSQKRFSANFACWDFSEVHPRISPVQQVQQVGGVLERSNTMHPATLCSIKNKYYSLMRIFFMQQIKR